MTEKATKRELKMVNTIYAHLMNMIAGLDKKYEYIMIGVNRGVVHW